MKSMNFLGIFDILKNLEAIKPLFEQAYNPIVITTAELDLPGPQFLYVNQAFTDLSGYTLDELSQKTPRVLQGEKSDRATLDRLKTTLKEGKFFQGSTINYKKDGSEYWVEWNISPIYDTNGNLSCYFCVQHDISAHKELEVYKEHLEDLVDEKVATIAELNTEIENTLKDTLFSMGEIAEAKSKETGFHVKRVAKYSQLLARYYGFGEDEIKLLGFASALHDIGKIAIADNILNKPGKLTQDEFEEMKKHSPYGYDMLKGSNRELFRVAAIIAISHHEKYDGTGYPNALKREEIHIYGRIVALADVFDALGSDRCYKKAWDDERVFEFIKDQKGKHFDPKLVDIFFDNLDEFLVIRDKYKEESI